MYWWLRFASLVWFLYLLLSYIHVYAIEVHCSEYIDERGVLQLEYFQLPILPCRHLWWVVNLCMSRIIAHIFWSKGRDIWYATQTRREGSCDMS